MAEVADVETGLTARATDQFNRYKSGKHALKKVLEQLIKNGMYQYTVLLSLLYKKVQLASTN